MESELYEAAIKGNVPSLLELLKTDKLLLDRVMIGNHTETPLHIAAMLGHLDFVKEILAQKAEMASVQDSQGSTPLHLAAAKGYLNIVESLVRAYPDACSFCDKYKRNPLHVAAMKGHVNVLENLVGARPDAAHSVIEHGQTILHLCVKHNRLEALKLLIDILGNEQFINLGDEDGNTILHLAIADRQAETIVFLINKGVNPNIMNSRGFTAVSLLAQGESAGRASEIRDYVPQISENQNSSGRTVHTNNKTLLVVAALLATVAYQAILTPPSGLWQEDYPSENATNVAGSINPSGGISPAISSTAETGTEHVAGESIMGYKYQDIYQGFLVCNTISFAASISTIMLLISGLPLKRRRLTTWIAMLIMWIAIFFTAATYTFTIWAFTPEQLLTTAIDMNRFVMLVWLGLMAIICLCHVVLLTVKLVRKVLKFVRSRRDPIGEVP
ncbi:ankyrin repeat-containing protein BDA1-like [Eucalyptus grandis]|uniref:ankyrin repeat-containing protein BDA1-like n=1 Tax=Eucalyptus grandis TaxID=71139 RepID=UPI00192E937F|nr:ankyrin repeat-containing protein BDA1-like [Eucalyptus grandis]